MRGALILSISVAHAAALSGVSAPAACDGKIVTSIVITPRDPSFLGVPRQLREVARGVGLLHTTSTQQTIGRFLLLTIGQPCTERARATPDSSEPSFGAVRIAETAVRLVANDDYLLFVSLPIATTSRTTNNTPITVPSHIPPPIHPPIWFIARPLVELRLSHHWQQPIDRGDGDD